MKDLIGDESKLYYMEIIEDLKHKDLLETATKWRNVLAEDFTFIQALSK